jgi:hypothetical protein
MWPYPQKLARAFSAAGQTMARCEGPLMVDITVHGDRVVFEVEGLDRLWALRSRLEIPLAHVIDVEINAEQVGRWWHGLKLLGTDVPGVFAAGTFYYHGELVFWDVRDPANTIIVTLDHERYKKLMVEVVDPAGTVSRLRGALRA